MKAHKCEMRAYCKWTKPYESKGKAHERKGSGFCNQVFIKMNLKIFLRTKACNLGLVLILRMSWRTFSTCHNV